MFRATLDPTFLQRPFDFVRAFTVQHMLKHPSCGSGALLEADPSPHTKPLEEKLYPQCGTCERESQPRQKEGTDAHLTIGSPALSPTKAQMAGVWERLDKCPSMAMALGIIKRQ